MRFEMIVSLLPRIDEVALRHFRSRAIYVNNKQEDGFDPVTAADRDIEILLRENIEKSFPEDGITGEEFGEKKGVSGYEWVIDPIDGTRAFLIGAPSFTTLIALKKYEETEMAVISQPFTKERFISDGSECFWSRDELRSKLQTSSEETLQNAIMASTFPEIGSLNEFESFNHLKRRTKLTRYGLDAYAYGLLAMGMIDLVVEAGLKPYDYQAPKGVVEAAGGVVTDWKGDKPKGESTILAAANPVLHEQAMKYLNP